MNKDLSPEHLRRLVNSAISTVNDHFDNLINGNDADKKKASILSYWINDYIHYISSENTAVPPNRKYNRGDVLLINFGYRIGSELGGKHFAVVIDNYNSKKSPIITVAPLTSLKENYSENLYTYALESSIYDLHMKKRQKLIMQASESVKELNKFKFEEENNSKFDRGRWERQLIICSKKLQAIDDLDNSIEKLKTGSVVSVGQITTISKQRILNPKNHDDTLSGIKLQRNDLDKLNERLINLYIH